MAIAMKYCGFTYEADGKGYYNIIPNKRIDKPKTLFKYYALSEYSVDALTNLYIYATHPNQFNDPFDCNEKLLKFTPLDVKHFMGDQIFEKFTKIYPNSFDLCNQGAIAFKTILYRHLGLCSLATSPSNYQMWALYSNNNGFCVEFDTNLFPFHHFGPFPMNYVREIKDAVKLEEAGGPVAMLIQTNIKNSWWEYENEWRLYIPNPDGFDMESFGPGSKQFNKLDEHNRKFKYPISAIKSIMLGPKFLNNEEETAIHDISLTEIDVICYNTNSLVSKMLKFLSALHRFYNIPVFISTMNGFSEFSVIESLIVEINDNQYRIIEK